jgi:tetratricopeptide (TPR) repeat protein
MSDNDETPEIPQPADVDPEEPTVHERLAARKEELAERDEADAEAATYRRRVAILLAAVAVLGAWIAVLQANAGINESTTARETTRTAVEAQSASVITEGLQTMRSGAVAEVQTLPLRNTFTQELADLFPGEPLPFTDGERVAAGLGIAVETAQAVVEGNYDLAFRLGVEQGEKSLERDALTEERITWNARASQYETVITVLGVALFLIAFTLVLSRKIRPPILVPGIVLVLYCLGWALWIYNKPIPDVSREAITATATGQVLLETGDSEGAVESYDTAIELDDDYLPPHAQRAIAHMSLANPDLFETFAVVDNTSETFQAAVDDALRALDLGGDEDITTLAVAGVLSLAANEYEIADEAINAAIGLNESAPGLYLAASATDAALGNFEEAQEDLDTALGFIQPAEPSGRIRALSADYFSWLGWVESQNPELADDVANLRNKMAAAEAFLTEGVEQSGVVPPGAGLRFNSAEYANDEVLIDLELLGLDDDDYIVLVVFERPEEGGQWVNAENMAFIGRAVVSETQGDPVPAVRACAPVEFRAELYVNGVFVGFDDAPGVAATC